MKLVIQRVSRASVAVDAQVVGRIQKGMVILLGVSKTDTMKDVDYCARKTIDLRMFEDSQAKMNLSVKDVKGEVLIVSQFTLYGNCDKGRRPSFDEAAEPKTAEHLYECFIEKLKNEGLKVETGRFKAMMAIDLVNSGPVTFIIESKK